MAGRDPTPANHFSGHPNFLPRIPPRRDSHRLHDAATRPSSGHIQLDGQWEGVPMAIGSAAAQGTMRDPHHTNMTHNGMPEYLPVPVDPVVPHVYANVGLARGVREHEQASFPDNQGNDPFHFARQGNDPRPGFPDALDHQAPAFGQPARENLRWFASRCVHHPSSQVDMIQMEPGFVGRYRVVIILDMGELP
ncbi:hypothetical protein F5148DRAFT_174052 [Russula earlei]|uniref:Uncharacterized protein n=1 Tax=Russula earlei TaxID=71964 RepID=A0ACC0U6C6_9AGAM|nr:hypothetical protein F5148DRAFT_174052 [Russula earlei]